MRKVLRGLGVLLLLAVIIGAGAGWYGLMKNNVRNSAAEKEVYVESDWNYDSLYDHLLIHILEEPLSFDIVARRMNLPSHIYPGKYVIKGKMGNMKLIRFFRSGSTTDVNVLIKAGMQLDEVAGAISNKLEMDSLSMLEELEKGEYISSLNFTKDEKLCMFLANTYAFNWASSPESVVKRFESEYQKFWNATNQQRAEALSLTAKEVGILASIVDGEVIYSDEMQRVAGVYLNRLRQDWALGADPTIRFMIKEEGRQRVLHKDLEKDHPYNTYKYKGLPPGPIGIPSGKAIEAVLDAEEHNYMFFCAKADLSGYHHFSVTASEHARFARAYHRALNQRGIMR